MNTQLCRSCGKEVPLDKFPKAGIINGKEYRRRKCQECYWAVKRDRRHRIADWLDKHKKTLRCAKCNNDDYRVLEFHHNDENKDFNMGDASRIGYSIKKIEKELAKCIIFVQQLP